MPTWPATLPEFAQVGMNVTPQDSVVRSSMDAGPPSRRNRFTATTTDLSYTMLLTGEQIGTLRAFYRDTLRNGALSFDWTDPVDGSAVSIAFKQPPQASGAAGAADPVDRKWIVSLSLEIQP